MIKSLELYIYVLIDPIDNRVRYVGKTKNPKRRESDHMRLGEAAKKRCLIDFWKLSLFELGTKPIFKIIDITTIDKIDNLEKFYITEYKKSTNLLNMTSGGDGLQDPSEETRRKIGEKSKGRRLSKEKYRELADQRISKNYGRPIICYDDSGKFIGEYPNSARASEELGINRKNIFSTLKERNHFIYNYTFFYQDDTDIELKLINRIASKMKNVGREFYRVDKNGDTELYNNLIKAATDNNLNFRNIWLCLNGLRKTTGGFAWIYCNLYDGRYDHFFIKNDSSISIMVIKDGKESIFKSSSEASKILNIHKSTICNYLKKKIVPKDGSIWLYV